ncbi:recombinase family protein [Sphingomonas montana]|uniref:recombinase family protein n=1 Tax=Sphingomonas montana TaxID=1843236 RepID=UPI00096C8335|nr:recombinase family protein [Sphingomonas montana]
MAKRTARPAAVGTGAVREVRCAIYTRKSTEEGLEQAFNSLDAQREACAAYIASQRHEGWVPSPALYDDGGYSGGTMERPGLKRLLADVASGRIDVIVVYKVDRLTRALSDFSKIVEILDATGASFVSVTQAFNTTTSMGRLTLNVLLSFAQFEREVTGERIRDKIAASKKKGMWMGGPVPLGYEVVERKLIVREDEAATVRMIFERHQALGTIRGLVDDLAARGVCSKRRVMRDGRVVGGKPFAAGAITHLLRNVIYTGHIPHRDNVYDGEHVGIVAPDVWAASQALLDCNAPRPHSGQRSILAGHIRDGHGRPMAAEHANKGGRRYRYYVSRALAGVEQPAWRLPAGDIETIVRDGFTTLFRDPDRVLAELGVPGAASDTQRQRCSLLADDAADANRFAQILELLDVGVTVTEVAVVISLSRPAVARVMNCSHGEGSIDDCITMELAVSLKRRGHEMRLVYAAPDARPSARDPRLIQLIASGRAAYDDLQAGGGVGDAIRRSHLTRLARLRFLAPDIITSIVHGRQPVELTARSLMRISELPMCWKEQQRVLGY